MTFNPIDLFFILFASMMLVSALGIVFLRQPIHGVLSLMLCFMNAAGLWLLLNAEFLAMVLIVVYVGAVTVFFLFVIMMFSPWIRSSLSGSAAWVTLILSVELGGMIVLAPDHVWVHTSAPAKAASMPLPGLGSVLYTQYAVSFQMTSLILLISMIGAIVLVLIPHQRPSPPSMQRKKRHIVLKKVPLHQGLSS